VCLAQSSDDVRVSQQGSHLHHVALCCNEQGIVYCNERDVDCARSTLLCACTSTLKTHAHACLQAGMQTCACARACARVNTCTPSHAPFSGQARVCCMPCPHTLHVCSAHARLRRPGMRTTAACCALPLWVRVTRRRRMCYCGRWDGMGPAPESR